MRLHGTLMDGVPPIIVKFYQSGYSPWFSREFKAWGRMQTVEPTSLTSEFTNECCYCLDRVLVEDCLF